MRKTSMSLITLGPKAIDPDGMCIKYILDGIIRKGIVPWLKDDSYWDLKWSDSKPLRHIVRPGTPPVSLFTFRQGDNYHEVWLPSTPPTWNKMLIHAGNHQVHAKVKAYCRYLLDMRMRPFEYDYLYVFLEDYLQDFSADIKNCPDVYPELTRKYRVHDLKKPIDGYTLLKRYRKIALGLKAYPKYMPTPKKP